MAGRLRRHCLIQVLDKEARGKSPYPVFPRPHPVIPAYVGMTGWGRQSLANGVGARGLDLLDGGPMDGFPFARE